jgi:hypothetical protein
MDTVNHTAVDIAPGRHLSVLKVINVFTTTKIITTTISITQGIAGSLIFWWDSCSTLFFGRFDKS